jgi:uncharacterized DUF497 family protein
MKFEWDKNKRLSNLHKHKIDFIDAKKIFYSKIVTIEDDRENYGEQRFITFGNLQGCVVAIVHTETDEIIRIISIRKATKYEERGYYAAVTN